MSDGALSPWTATGGDDFDDLYDHCFATVVAVLRLLGADEATAEDCAERAFAEVVVRWRTVRDPVAHVHRAALRLHRRAEMRSQIVRSARRPFRAPVETGMRVRTAAEAVLADLPFRTRACAVLTWYAGCSPALTARILRRRRSSVDRHLDRARRSFGVPELDQHPTRA